MKYWSWVRKTHRTFQRSSGSKHSYNSLSIRASGFGTFEDFANSHPTSALLVVEVADTTLDYDRGRKASLYASAGIADYWIVNLRDKHLEVCRRPVRDRLQPFGFRYDQITVLKSGRKIAPLAKSKSLMPVGKLLP